VGSLVDDDGQPEYSGANERNVVTGGIGSV
jgi:hypothetical protein